MNAVSLKLRRLLYLFCASSCWALFAPTFSFGDIAPNPLSGGVNFYAKTDKVEMSEETVTMNVSATRCKTHAIFHMKNLTKEPVSMDVGFPFAYPTDLQEFRAKVNGKEIKNVAEKTAGKRQKWKVWTMTFPAGKTTKVEVDYWNDLTAIYSWVTGIDSVPKLLLSFTSYKMKPRGKANEEEQKQYNELAQQLQHKEVRYILKTGAGWAGNIGKCKVIVKFDGVTTDNLITQFPIQNEEYQPRDPKVMSKEMTWELKDFEPKDDIYFQISPNITQQEVREMIEATLKKHPHHPRLTRLYGEYCKYPEEKLDHEKMIDEMLAHWSTRFAIDGPDYVDKTHAHESFQVWFIARKLTFQRYDSPPLSEARLKKLLPVFRKIALRMQSQVPQDQPTTDRLNAHQVKTFKRESELLLKWVEDPK